MRRVTGWRPPRGGHARELRNARELRSSNARARARAAIPVFAAAAPGVLAVAAVPPSPALPICVLAFWLSRSVLSARDGARLRFPNRFQARACTTNCKTTIGERAALRLISDGRGAPGIEPGTSRV